MSAHLSDKTVLANFSVSRWGGHRYDKRATDEVHKNNEAASDTGAYNKRLLPKGATGKIDSAVNAARDYHRMNTLPWMEDGTRILPATKYMEYASRMGDYRREFEGEVQAFLKEYPAHQKAGKARLGKLYNEADYPPAKQLADWYRWDLTVLPFPDARDFRVAAGTLPDDEVKRMREDLQKQMDTVWNSAMKDTGQRIVDVVGRMSERLKSYKPGKAGKRAEGTFKDSLVGNVRELVELLPTFNLTGDKKFGKIIDTMQKELCKHDADLLRDDDKARKKVAQSADQILAAVADYIA